MNLRNFPIPEGHLIPLVIGVVLQFAFPVYLIAGSRIGILIGMPILLAGILLIAWCLRAVNSIEVDSPSQLVTTGPYAFSRNPMYVAWTLIYISAVLILNSIWLLVLLPPVLAYTHLREVLREEKSLEDQFGDEYRGYKDNVGRYF